MPTCMLIAFCCPPQPVEVLLQWSGETALHMAAVKGRVEVVRQLLRAGAGADVVDRVRLYLPLWVDGDSMVQYPPCSMQGLLRCICGSTTSSRMSKHVAPRRQYFSTTVRGWYFVTAVVK
jgi:hypothetical protein